MTSGGVPKRALVVAIGSLEAAGGIQRLTAQYLLALQDLGWQTTVLEKAPGHVGAGHLGLAVRGLLQADPPHIIIGNHVNTSPVAVMLGRRYGARSIVLAHGDEVWDGPTRRLSRWAANQADVVACSSDYTRNRIARTWLTTAPSRTMYPAVLPDQSSAISDSASNRASVPAGAATHVLTVSRLVQHKGLLAMLDAVTGANRAGAEIAWTVVGEGPLSSALYEGARARGIADRVRLLGRVTDEELAAAYASSDLFALPSVKEGFGIVYLEAMSRGLPALAVDVGATPEVICDGAGWTVPPGDVSALTDALLNFHWMDTYSRNEISAAAEACAAGFGFEGFRNRLERLLGGIGLTA